MRLKIFAPVAALLLFAAPLEAVCVYFRTAVKLEKCREADAPSVDQKDPYEDASQPEELNEPKTGLFVHVVCSCDYSLKGSDLRCDVDQTVERSVVMNTENIKTTCRRGPSLCREICAESIP